MGTNNIKEIVSCITEEIKALKENQKANVKKKIQKKVNKKAGAKSPGKL